MTINRHDMAPTENALRHALSEPWNAPRRALKSEPYQYRVKIEELLNLIRTRMELAHLGQI